LSFWPGRREPRRRHSGGRPSSIAFGPASNPAAIEGDPVRIRAAEERLRPLKDALSALRIKADDVLVAETYTTESVIDETTVLAAAYRAQAAPVINLDPDGDGMPNLYAKPGDDPKWEGPKNEDDSGASLLVRFSVDVPSFRVGGVKGPLALDAMQATLQSKEKVEGLLMIPKGAGPFPVVLYQHGIGDRKESAWRFAPDFASSGSSRSRSMRRFTGRARIVRRRRRRSSSTSSIRRWWWTTSGRRRRSMSTSSVRSMLWRRSTCSAMDRTGSIHRARFGSVTRWDR